MNGDLDSYFAQAEKWGAELQNLRKILSTFPFDEGLYFSAAKQSKTRAARIGKVIPRIIDGFGLNDCTCGLSKRMPQCDGSHKSLKPS